MKSRNSCSHEQWICHCCVGDQYLAEEILAMNRVGHCTICGNGREGIPLDSLADRIHKVFQKQFELTPPYPVGWYEHWAAEEGNWEQRGEPAETLIAEITELPESMSCTIAKMLSDRYKYRAVKDGGVDPYGVETFYEEKEPSAARFYVSWDAFRKEILTRARFFPKTAERNLEDIFGDLNELETMDGTPVIRKIIPGDSEGVFWRARRAETEKEIETMLEDPAGQLGPPPSKKAKSLRMNATGIPVFYGAGLIDTCLSEIRPPVGSKVVVAKFRLQRPLRVLDLRALEEVLVGKSHFDPGYVVSRGRAAFLKQLVTEISRPVMPEDEELEYIPTQFVAEFLAHRSKPRLDGLLYPSTQTGGEGENVVIFNHSCDVEPYQLPEGADVEVYGPSIHQEDEEWDGDYEYTVYEFVPDEHAKDTDLATDAGTDENDTTKIETVVPMSDTTSTLRLDVRDVKVVKIRDAKLNTDTYEVTRNRFPKSWKSKSPFTRVADGNLDDLLPDSDTSF